MISKKAQFHAGVDMLVGSKSTASHRDKVTAYSTVLESLASFTSHCHVESHSRRRSSNSISPIEELFARIQGFKENSQSRLSETDSGSQCGVSDNTHYVKESTTVLKEITFLSPQEGSFLPALRFGPFTRRYSFR